MKRTTKLVAGLALLTMAVPHTMFAQNVAADPFATSSTAAPAAPATNDDPFATAQPTTTAPAATTTTATDDPFATAPTATTPAATDDPFAPTPGTDAGAPLPATNDDPFATAQPTGTTDAGVTNSDPFAADGSSDGLLTAESVTELKGHIESDSTNTTLSVTIPKSIISNPTSKALVQLQYCFLDGKNCIPADQLSPTLKTENETSAITNIAIVDTNQQEMKVDGFKIITLDNSETVQLTKLPKPEEGSVKLYNTTIELGTYDNLPSDVTVATSVSPAALEYSFEAETGKPFARVVIIDSASGQQTIIPVVYEGPVVEEVVPVQEETKVEEVKKAETGLETNIMLILGAIALAGVAFYRKLND